VGSNSGTASKVVKATGYVRGVATEIELSFVGKTLSGKDGYLRSDIALVFAQMQSAAKHDGIDLLFNSCFRTMDEQRAEWKAYQIRSKIVANQIVNRLSPQSRGQLVTRAQAKDPDWVEVCRAAISYAYVEKLSEIPKRPFPSAKPGYSRHQNGIAVDFDLFDDRGNERLAKPWLEERGREWHWYRTVTSEHWHYECHPEGIPAEAVPLLKSL
jgi:hypothetical protein